MVRWLVVSLLVVSAGCQCTPAYDGVPVPETIDHLVTHRGFVYATGNFRPTSTTRGAASFTVVDAESLCIKQQPVVHPHKDLARSQYREWSFEASAPHLLGAKDQALVGIFNAEANDTQPMQLVRFDLRDPFEPAEIERREFLGAEPGSVVWSSPISEDAVLFGVTPASPSGASSLVLTRLSTLEHAVLADPVVGASPQVAIDPQRRLVYSLNADAASSTQQWLVAVRFDAGALTLVEASRTVLTGLTFPRSLIVLPDGSLAVSDGGVSGKPPVLRLFTLDADGRATPSRTVALSGTDAANPLFVSGGGLLVSRKNELQLFDAALPGTTATPIARLTSAGTPRRFVPLVSPSEPAASIVVLPMGNEGMLLVEVGTGSLVSRRGFIHGWNTNGIPTKTFGLYE